MLIVAPIVILVIGVFVTAIVSMTGDVLSTRASNSLAYNVQDALNRIKQDVNLSGGYLAVSNIPIASPQGYDNDIADFHNAGTANGTMLILNTYTTTSNPLTSDRTIIYRSSPNPCTSSATQISQNPPVMTNTIYFVKDNTLWRRVVAPSNYKTVGCYQPWQQPSCAPGLSGTMCKTQDIRLVDGIQDGGFSVKYYPSPSSTAENSTARGDSGQTDSVRQTALSTTNTVEVTINATSTVAGRDISQSGTIRSVSPNNNIAATSDAGLILNLDAGDSKSYPGSGTTWTDLSTNVTTSDGTLEGGVGYSASYGGVLTFNGTTGYVHTPSSSFLPLIGHAYTIAAWIKDDTSAATLSADVNHRVVSFANGTINIQLGLASDDAVNRFFYIQESADSSIMQQITDSAPPGSWYYVAATSDGLGNWHMYLNGTVHDNGTDSGSNTFDDGTSGYLYIGQRGNGAYIAGSLSNVNIYNRALSTYEVQQNFNALCSRYSICG